MGAFGVLFACSCTDLHPPHVTSIDESQPHRVLHFEFEFVDKARGSRKPKKTKNPLDFFFILNLDIDRK